MNFTIDYEVVLKDKTLYDKSIIVKNRENEFFAKTSLESYLRRKYGDNFVKLIITNCKKESDLEFLKSIFTWL
jgi:hypothetical protein